MILTEPDTEPNATANNVMVTKSVMLHSTEELAPELVRKRESLDYKAAGEIPYSLYLSAPKVHL